MTDRSTLLGQTAILPASFAVARAAGGAKVLGRAALALTPPKPPRAKARRYLVEGGDPGEITHHRPITRKTREAYQAYLIRYGAEVREQLVALGKTPAEVEAGVIAAVSAPPHKLERPTAGTTRLRGTALVDLSKLP